VHGEEEAIEEVSRKIEEELKIKTYIPELRETLSIEGETALAGRRIEIDRRSKEGKEIGESIEKLKSTFGLILPRLEYETNVGADNKELNINNIKNKLIEIQKSILDLNMLITKGKKEEED
jgi:metallo-beta-lactamase family protein